MVEGEGEGKVGQNERAFRSEEKGEGKGVNSTKDEYKVICALTIILDVYGREACMHTVM